MEKPEGFYAICGYRVCGKRAVRVDMLERLSDLIRDRVFWKPRIPEEQRPAGSVEGGGFTVVSDMMSLVGCSGEEFEEILRSLGFRDQKKQVSKPAPFVLASPTAVVETAVVESSAEAPAEIVADAAPEPNVEAAPEPVAEPNAEPAPTPEMIEINVWWPKDTGPFRKPPERKERPQFKKPEALGGEAKPKFNRPDRHRGKGNSERLDRNDRPPPRPAKPEKPMDPNSPFAALAALREQLKQR